MSRRFVGTWADRLFSVAPGQAIAALGVLLNSTSRNLRLDTAEQISAELRATVPPPNLLLSVSGICSGAPPTRLPGGNSSSV